MGLFNLTYNKEHKVEDLQAIKQRDFESGPQTERKPYKYKNYLEELKSTRK